MKVKEVKDAEQDIVGYVENGKTRERRFLLDSRLHCVEVDIGANGCGLATVGSEWLLKLWKLASARRDSRVYQEIELDKWHDVFEIFPRTCLHYFQSFVL